MKNYLLMAIASLTLGSCAPTFQQSNQDEISKAREHWVGATENELLRSWGPPNTRTSDGQGGKIYTYRRNNGYLVWVTNFYINSQGTIYDLNAHSE